MKKLLLLSLSFILVLSLFAACTKKPEEPTPPPEPTYTEGLIIAENSAGGCSVVGYKGTDTDIVIPDEYGGYAVTAIANSAFAGNTSITSFTAGANLKSIDAAAFAGCVSLAEVSLGSSLERIGSASFFGCSNLNTVSIPATVKQIGVDAFAACDSVETVNYDGNQSMWERVNISPNNPAFDTKLVLADGGAMVKVLAEGKCNSAISWRLGYDEILIISGKGHIPDYEFDKIPWGEYTENISEIIVEDGIDVIGKNAFLNCYNARKVSIPNSVRLIDNSAFYNCSALTNITLPENLRRIGESAFFGCDLITSIEIPNTVTAIGSGAFMGCAELKSVTLSDKVTTIEPWTFANCESLATIDLSNVIEVEANAFFRCSSLTSVKVSSAMQSIGFNAFNSCPQVFVNGTLPSYTTIAEGNPRIHK